jgi:mono/diheme cytochrome c family protein
MPARFVSLAILLASASAAEVDFQGEVQPIFAEYCLECHGPNQAKGGLNLTTREGFLRALKSGAHAVVPGRPEASAMLGRMRATDPDEVMPPASKAKRPTEPEMEILRRWIEQGAVWEPHWAYRAIVRPDLPAGPETHPVDRFVGATRRKIGLEPSPEADRATLVKRVYADLLGLPPGPEEVEAFLRDASPGAYESLVERALASPHFGERWGRHWLDQARYADSDGYEKDRPRPDAWRYRDWVIEACNADLPIDRFTIEQLAGDLLPEARPGQILATAFHRQTLTNTEGGVDQEQYRVEAVFDRTETTGTVWLAHTVGCARCHTHKYDQISHREYFGLYAFFNNADEANARVGTSAGALATFERENAVHAGRLRALEKKLRAARAGLAERFPSWEKETAARMAALEGRQPEAVPLTLTGVKARSGAQFSGQADGSWLVSGAEADTEVVTFAVELPPGPIGGMRLEVIPDASLPAQGPGRSPGGNFVLSEIEVRTGPGGELQRFHSAKADFSQSGWAVAGAIDGRTDTGWGIGGGIGKPHQATFFFVRPVDGRRQRELTISLVQAHRGRHGIGRFRMVALAGETVESALPAEVARLVSIGSEKWTNEGREIILDWLARLDPVVSGLTDEFAGLEAAGPKPPLMEVRVLAERAKPRDTRLLHRGEFLSPREPVGPGTPAVLPPLRPRGETEGRPDRLDLANWLMAPENPLPARVMANQIWMHLFGEGIVRTPSDFGVRGERPSHPELLDWLASELVAHGWSRKHLIRVILMSATYRQASGFRPDLQQADPRNVFLARQNRLRAEGEIVRDLHLAAAGLLSRKTGGPSVFPPMPPEVAAVSYANNFKWTESKGEDRYRRGMYTFFKRTAPYPDLMTFDCPDANVASVRRNVSNTPLQALTTLNAATFAEASLALARRLLASPEEAGDAVRLERAFRLCLIRSPRPDEIRVLEELLQEARAYYAAHEAETAKLGGEIETAAWTATARILLNTDEFITRE